MKSIPVAMALYTIFAMVNGGTNASAIVVNTWNFVAATNAGNRLK